LLVAVIAAAVGVAALLFSRAQPTRYQAVAKVSFSSSARPELQILGSAFVRTATDVGAFTATNAQIMSSYRVARDVARDRPELRLSPDEVDARVAVAPLGNTEVIQISAWGDTPTAARRLTDAYVTVFRAWYRERERTRARAVRRALRDRYETFSRSQRRSETGAAVRNQLTTLNVLEEVGSGSPDLIEGAHGSGVPEQPKTRRNVLFGVLFGLAVGIGLVALRAELSRRVPTSPSRPS
jgi:capsular polysaccharide biosynthesis protein